MPFESELEIEVVKRTGHCSVDHNVGDTFRITNYETPAPIRIIL